MSLIGTARALDDQRFKWRVRAALLKIASIKKDSQLPAEIAYAKYLLQNPMVENAQLEALCATDIGVTEKVTVDQNNTVNTEGVADDTLIYVADVNFGWMAEQYAAQQAGTAGPSQVFAVGGTATGF